ncbi:16S rRNA (adenine(1518)-N(6)/adenine(1519)-N(6))-dimethyltransferase RsmA [Parachitinimonas caeni]|uniref:Ribosomal RNA small subunit methyltransferase A n=1 Tax=Parachitinimonas caeni TaxID=3031301 RepID=A0ABT7DY62_9NEIS|nr:16S rRNA (adenine(1518)-N(6)/adenine(1519)-N(6))-dimethyltransferase RsmA [Parachitinimonas caeni]MDK2124997.1 16S rRNA (adenine(1518)-N(6)/adenine(1519)-N(6))-dimethyltransferase RsmA [Parachitinimonas caeni]
MSAHIPRKRFGQNFLQDRGVITDIVSAIDPKSDDPLVEIGPGLAALSQPLMDRVKVLHAVELDRDIVKHLTRRFPAERLRVHNCDALAFDFRGLRDEIAPGKQIRVVGNLPYNISTPLLFHLASQSDAISDMHFMLQKEVVDRMVAEPGNTDYGKLSVMLQFRFYMEKLLDVPPHAFDPPPKVDSAVVRLIPLPQPLADIPVEALEKVVTQAFTQRRKTLRNNLKGWFDDTTLESLGINPGARAENLSVMDYIKLAQRLI